MRDRRASQIQNTPRQPRTTKGRPRAPPTSRQGLLEQSRSFLAFHEFRARERERARETESDRTRRLDFKTSFRFTGSTLAARRRRVSLTPSVAYLFTVSSLWGLSCFGTFLFGNVSSGAHLLAARPKIYKKISDMWTGGGVSEMFREEERYKGKPTRKSRPQFAGFFCHWADLNRSGHSEESERRGGVESST